MKSVKPGKEAFIRYECNRLIIRSYFNPEYVEELKSKTTTRKWNSEKKEWSVNISEKEKTLDILGRYFKVLEDTNPAENQAFDPQKMAKPGKGFAVQEGDKLEIWTDGACSGNPGGGGYAALLKNNGQVKEIAGGFAHTTNNRMEIMAAIAALEPLDKPCDITIYSDSKYLVDAVSLGWVKKWQANGWMRTKKDKAVNPDLWQRLLDLCAKHTVRFVWVKGHAANRENKRCDEIAEAITHLPDLPEDKGYRKEMG